MAGVTSHEHTLYFVVENQAQIITMVSLEASSHPLRHSSFIFIGVISKNIKNKNQKTTTTTKVTKVDQNETAVHVLCFFPCNE